MKRIISLISILVLVAMVSCISDPLPVAYIPSVSLGIDGKGYLDNNTGEEGELMRTSVRLYGFSVINNSTISVERGFYVGHSVEDIQNGTASEYIVSSNYGSFFHDITGLEIDHTYYFCAYIKEGNQVAKSSINSFHTKADGFALVNEIKQKGNTIVARVSDNGGCEIKRVGFCYSIKENPDIFDTVISAELGEDGEFSAELSSLEPSETYYFRAFADNGVSGNRISYSDVLSITSESFILEVENDSYLVDSEGGEFVLPVMHNYPIEVSIDVDWIQKLSTKAAILENLRFQVQPSTETKERVGSISLSYQGNPDEQIITITQKAGAFVIDFPDANFKAYCVQNFDQDGDGEVSNLEALEVTSIDVRTEHIETLRGIEHFANLQSLNCSPLYKRVTYFSPSDDYQLVDASDNLVSGSLVELDLSQNIQLRSLDCTGNNITTLDLSKNEKLHRIDVKYNRGLSTFVLPNSQNITDLSYGATKVGNIDLRRFLELRYLECYYSGTTEIDVAENKKLSRLFIASNKIQSINLANNNDIENLSCDACELSALDVSNLTGLTSLSCSYNNLTSLDVRNLTKLHSLTCYNNNLTTLDVGNLAALSYLSCSHNNLTSLDVSNLTALTHLYCSDNNLSALDVSNLTALINLGCSDNNLSALDVSNLTGLTSLSCSNNNLTILDVSNLTGLTSLSCSNNNLSSLNVSNLTSLTDLSCSNNNLTSLDVGNLTSLTVLLCSRNNLISLDVSNLAELIIVDCQLNNLSFLDVSNLTKLTDLSCGGNNLSSLDVSSLPSLTDLFCYDNNLSSLDVSNLKALFFLSCGNNNLTSLDVSNNLNLSELWTFGNPNLTEIWLKEGQTIDTFTYDSSISTIYYK